MQLLIAGSPLDPAHSHSRATSSI
uniref:Uncharacterized protein n=1 Tax=Anguilla anguilla TaxID=7936 RepID=A0A0E9PG46_ANGAN